MKTWISRVLKIVLMTVFGAMLFLVGAFVLLPKAMGWMPLAVLTGSMRPHLPPGTEIVVDPIDNQGELDALKVGDVVTYMPHSGQSDVITHRIISISKGLDGHRSFIFQGDNNPSPDPNPVAESQIRGKLLYYAPLLGWVTTKLPVNQKSWGMDAVAVGLFGYAVWQVFSSVRSIRRARRDKQAQALLPRHNGWVLPEDLRGTAILPAQRVETPVPAARVESPVPAPRAESPVPAARVPGRHRAVTV
jgi:signal peptidase I